MTAAAAASGSERDSNEERLARLRAVMTKLGVLAYLVLEIELVVSVWGDWRAIGWITFFSAIAPILNFGVNRLAPRIGSRWTEYLRLAANLVTLLAFCHLSGWGFPGLAMLVLMGVAHGASDGPDAIGLTLAVALIGAGLAASDGAGVLVAATLATAIEGAFWLAYCCARVGTELIEQLDARHRELAEAHAQLRKMQQIALEQEKLAGLGMMAAGIAHEINNPMSFVTSNVTMLLQDMRAARQLPPELKEYVDDILPVTVDGIRRVNAIVSDMRRFARGDADLRAADYDLNEQVGHALRLANHQLEPRCKVACELGEVPPLNGRAQQITQVLVNLLVNAAQAIPREGTITVATHRTATEALVAVRDTGTGMSRETLGHLFEPFFTTKPVGTGTGLGLAVIHGIAKAHGGRIEVESELGKGSCFTLCLPLSEEDVLDEPKAAPRSVEPVVVIKRRAEGAAASS